MARKKSNRIDRTDQREEIREKVSDIYLKLHCAAEICDKLVTTANDANVINGIKSLFDHAENQVIELETMMLTAGMIEEQS